MCRSVAASALRVTSPATAFLSIVMVCHASLFAQKRDMFQFFERHAFRRVLHLTLSMRCNVRPKCERALFVANC